MATNTTKAGLQPARTIAELKELRALTGNADGAQREGGRLPIGARPEYADARRSSWWLAEPDVGRVANGVAARVDRLKAIGNGQVPTVAAAAFRELSRRFG